MKKLFFFPLFVILASLFIFVWWKNASSPVDSKDSKPRAFVVTRGQGASAIAKRLAKEGLIKSDFALRTYLELRGKTDKIQAGEYRLTPSLSLQQIVAALLLGPQELWVTFPEGFRREEIAAKTIDILGMEGERAQVFWQDFLEETRDREGFLFPDTYLFPRDVAAKAVASRLRSIFDTKATQNLISDAKASGLSLNEVITLASIVERETLTDEERPIVAGILLKRLEAGWPLQADATLQYALATVSCRLLDVSCKEWWPQPTSEDKKLKSPYNTYLNRGLPPAPIANPGISSIKAVIYPQDSPYWFYLHDGSGKIHYAKTIEEHGENIRKYLQ